MKITCQKCGETISLNSLGRKPLNIPLIKVCEAVRDSPTAAAAAKLLDCSEGYIFKVLKDNGLKLKNVIEGKP